MENRVKYGVKGAFFVYTEIILSRAIAFLVPILLVRNLTKEEYGIFVLVPSLMLVIAYFTSFGLEDVIARYVPEYLKKRSFRRVNRLVVGTTLIRLATIAVILVVLFVFKDAVARLLSAPPLFVDIFSWILLFIGITRLTYLVGDTLTSAYKQRHYVSVVRMLVETMRLALFALVVWRGGGIRGIVIAMCGYRLVELTIYGVLGARKLTTNMASEDAGEQQPLETKRIARFASLSFMGRGFHTFRNIMVDNLVIAYFLSPVAVAGYGLAAFFPNLLRSFAPSRMLWTILQPLAVEEYIKDRNTPFLGRIHQFLQKLNMFLLFPMAAGMLVLAEKIIVYIFRPDYLDVLNVVYVLVVPLLFTTFVDAFFLMCEVLERKEIVLKSSIFALYNLVLDIILIPKYGLMGAAVATGSASVLLYMYIWWVFRFSLKVNFRFPFRSAARILINTAIMAVIVWLIRGWIGSAAMVIAAVILGVVVYGVCAYFNKAFSRDERRMINDGVGKNWFIF